ncbi:SH3 domain-containing protein [Candidatus Dependentiae bacterium]|nr:SH3 domain-containing protein [Candidatus Dependentiae bacterium]
MIKFNRVLAFLLCLTASGLSVKAEHQNPQEVFLYGNELYKKGDYTEALKQYEQILHKTPQLFYNMGNCAYKLKKFGYALLYWRKAEYNWGISGRDELIKNIALVKKELVPDASGKKISGIKKASECLSNEALSLIKAIPLLWLQLAVLLMWLFLFLYLHYLHRKGRAFVIACLFSFLALAASMLTLKYGINFRQYGVVVAKQGTLRAGPGDTYKTLGEVSQADEVRIFKKTDDFYKITTRGTIGWISQKELEVI